MKKLRYIIPIVVVVLAAGGFALFKLGANSQKRSEEAKTEQVGSRKKQKKVGESKSSKKSQKENNSKKSSSSSDSTSHINEASSSKGTTSSMSRITTLNQAIKKSLGDVLLPQNVAYDNNQKLNARFTGDQNNYSVFYSTGQEELALNASSLSNVASVATVQKKTYSTANAAQDNVNYQPAASGLPTVDLGYGISGTVQGAAGSSYLSWQEGRWSVTVQADSKDSQDPQILAKQLVSYFEKATLPVPDVHGAVLAKVGQNSSLGNTIAWTKGDSLYLITGINPMLTLNIGTSLK